MATPLALVWDLIAKDNASPAFGRVSAAADKTAASTGRAALATEGASKKIGASLVAMGKGAALVGAVVAAESLKMAGDFQQNTNVLVTAAGESVDNLKLIRAGILNISTGTGTSWKEVTDGIYGVEKAGYRGADALQIMKAAAQGAREEGANLATVGQAMTSVMASYHLKASDAVMVMNEMKTAAGEAKTTMELFSGSLSTVLPLASANKISFADVAGSLASLTQHGTTADEAAQELAFTMRGLAAPNQVAIKEMAKLGISSIDVARKLGDGPGGRGLAGTLNYLSRTVLSKMGKSGLVLLNVFNETKMSAKAVQTELANLPPAVQKTARAFLDGSITGKDWQKFVRTLPVDQANLAREFATTTNRARGFQTELRSGLSRSQTFSDALKKMTGGANGLNTVLQLTGESMAGTNERIDAIAKSAEGAGKNVSGWDSTQKLFNVEIDRARQTVDKWLIQLGMKLIPLVERAVGWIREHKKGFQELGAVIEHVATWAYNSVILPAIKAVVPVVVSLVNWIREHKKGLLELAHVIGDVLGPVFQASLKIWEHFVTDVKTAIHWVTDFIGVVESLKSSWQSIGDATGLTKAWHGIRRIFQEMKSFIDDIKQGMIDIGLIGETVQGHGSLSPALQKQVGDAAAALVTPTVKPRASGGKVTAGHPYIVGEHRRELFVPDENGYVMPKVPTATGSTTITQNFYNALPETPSMSVAAAMRAKSLRLGR